MECNSHCSRTDSGAGMRQAGSDTICTSYHWWNHTVTIIYIWDNKRLLKSKRCIYHHKRKVWFNSLGILEVVFISIFSFDSLNIPPVIVWIFVEFCLLPCLPFCENIACADMNICQNSFYHVNLQIYWFMIHTTCTRNTGLDSIMCKCMLRRVLEEILNSYCIDL